MDLDRAIDYTNRLLLTSRQRTLSQIETTVFKTIWLDLAYQDASKDSNYEVTTIKNAASKLLQDLSKATQERVTKKTCKSIILRLASNVEGRIDWGNAPIDVQPFCGRDVELRQLSDWISRDRCKLIGILGFGGIGKTTLAARLGDQVSTEFSVVIWRSLREAPPLSALLSDLVQFLSKFTEIELPDDIDRAMARLLYYLQQQRCLIILDNAEALMESGDYAGQYRAGYHDYGQLLSILGTARHQSCLLLTSREPAPEFAELAGDQLPVRSLHLVGLDTAALQLLAQIGLQATNADLTTLINRCQGNPLYLRIVANTILQTFNGDVAKFLTADQYTYGKIPAVLQTQLDRLTPTEKVILHHLAIKREPQTFQQLEQHLEPLGLVTQLGQSIDSLNRRSLLETTQTESYTLQNVVMEFMTAATIQELAAAILGDRDPFFFNHLSLYPASSPTYIRTIQQRLILHPLINQLLKSRQNHLGQNHLVPYLERLLQQFPQETIGYATGNLINILIAQQADLSTFDFTHRYIAEVDLQEVSLQNVNCREATFAQCRFAQVLGMPIRILFSPDGRWLAVGDTNSQIKIWEVSTMQEIATLTEHQGWVRDVSFSADSQLLASGSSDGTIRVWDIASQTCLQVLQGHSDWVWRVQFASRKSLLVSFGVDRQCKVWYWKLGKAVLSLTIKDQGLRNVMFDPKNGVVAVCSIEGIKLWLIWRLQYLRSITEKATHLRRIVFSPDGKMLVGADLNCQIHCWKVDTGELIHTLTGHTSQISEVNFSDSGQIVSTCLDQIRVWHPSTGTCLRTIQLSQAGSRVADYRPPHLHHPELLATGSDNGIIKLWNISTGECMMSATGRSAQMIALAVNPTIDNQIATGDSEGRIQLWQWQSTEAPQPQICAGHRGMVLSLAYSPSGQILASGSHDRTLKLWHPQQDTCLQTPLQTLVGHTDHIAQILFLDEHTLLTSSYDCTLRQWHLPSGTSKILALNNYDFILGMALSPNRQTLALATPKNYLELIDRISNHVRQYTFIGNRIHYLTFTSNHELVGVTDDAILNYWDQQGNLISHWRISDREIRAIALHPHNPHQLATTGDDGQIRLWDLSRQTCLATTPPQDSAYWNLGILRNGHTVTCSEDGSITLWDLPNRQLLAKINSGKPYQGFNIAGAKGLNRSQITTLRKMGATID